MPIHTINVTQKHIDDGIKSSCSSCPIALAINEILLNKDWKVLVFRHTFIFKNKDKYQPIHVPTQEPEMRFISKFDDNIGVSPFSFQLEVPDAIL